MPMPSKRNARLVKRHGGKVMTFRRLPLTAKLALIHYLAVQHDAWEHVAERDQRRMVAFYDSRYGEVKFGFAMLPMKALTDEIMRDDELSGHGTFAKYHRWYVTIGQMPRHRATNLWPVILSDFEDETLDDGWHRLHNYYDLGVKKVPAVWFV